MKRLLLLSLGALRFILLAPAAEADKANVEHVFLERSAISAADEACNLFSDGERFALKAGLYQAEGELLRANYSQDKIDDTADEVRAHAKSLGCDNPVVREAAQSVRDSYRAFAKINAMDYPGAHGVWSASRETHDQWALREQDKPTGVILGLHRDKKNGELRLAAALPDSMSTPASAQLFIRDPSRMGQPWLGSLYGSSGALTPTPRAMTKTEWAGETTDEDDISGNGYTIFFFSKTAIARIEALDPREAVLLELTPDPREKTQTPVRILFEAGDFRAAHNFVLIPQPTYKPPNDDKSPAKPAGKAG